MIYICCLDEFVNGDLNNYHISSIELDLCNSTLHLVIRYAKLILYFNQMILIYKDSMYFETLYSKFSSYNKMNVCHLRVQLVVVLQQLFLAINFQVTLRALVMHVCLYMNYRANARGPS